MARNSRSRGAIRRGTRERVPQGPAQIKGGGAELPPCCCASTPGRTVGDKPGEILRPAAPREKACVVASFGIFPPGRLPGRGGREDRGQIGTITARSVILTRGNNLSRLAGADRSVLKPSRAGLYQRQFLAGSRPPPRRSASCSGVDRLQLRPVRAPSHGAAASGEEEVTRASAMAGSSAAPRQRARLGCDELADEDSGPPPAWPD